MQNFRRFRWKNRKFKNKKKKYILKKKKLWKNKFSRRTV